MILSSRDLRDWTPLPRRAVDEHVERCAACAELTPHVRVIRRRSWLVLAGLALGVSAVLRVGANESVLLAGAAACVVVWTILCRRGRASEPKCVRCLDRPRRERGSYLIDFFF